MRWQPEQGWPWLAGRWAIAAGAGALLGGAVWFGEPGPDRALALEPTATREVVLDPQEQAELSSLVPAPDAATAERPGSDDGDDADDPDRADDSDPDGGGAAPDRDGDTEAQEDTDDSADEPDSDGGAASAEDTDGGIGSGEERYGDDGSDGEDGD